MCYELLFLCLPDTLSRKANFSILNAKLQKLHELSKFVQYFFSI